jgi:hypothetical protein
MSEVESDVLYVDRPDSDGVTIEGENALSAAINLVEGTLYVGLGMNPGVIAQVDLGYFGADPGNPDMSSLDAVRLNAGETNALSVTVRRDGRFAYVGTGTSPGTIIKFTAFGGLLTRRPEQLNLDAGENIVLSAMTDSTFGYFGTNTRPGRIIKVDLYNMTRVDDITLGTDEDLLRTVVADRTQAYFGTNTSPANLVKVRLAPVVDVADNFCELVDSAAIPAYARLSACWLFTNDITVNNPFGPSAGVTRAQMGTFLWRAAGEPAARSACGFADEAVIPTYARQGACWMLANGITQNNPFDPGGSVTRGQMAAFLWRAAGQPSAPLSCGFTDEATIPGYARQGACWLLAEGVTRNNPFEPGAVVTRAQMAAFLNRLYTLN